MTAADRFTFTDRTTLSTLIDYEAGTLGHAETLRLFGTLVRTGLAWSLQGSYGRAAHALIACGWLHEDGTPDPVLLASLCQEPGCQVGGHHFHAAAPQCERAALGCHLSVVPEPEPEQGTYPERVEQEGGPQ